MPFTRLRTVYRRRKASASPEQQHPRPRTAPATTTANASTSTPSLLPPVPLRNLVDTTTLHSSLAPTARPEPPRRFSSTLALATSDGVHEEGNSLSSSSPSSPGGGVVGGGSSSGDSWDREELIRHMRDQLSTANSVIRFLHEHVDGMREDRDRYRDRAEELKSLARLTLDMLEGAHRREWDMCRDVKRVRETAVAVEAGGVEQRQQKTTGRRRRDSLMRKIGLGSSKKEGKEREKEKEVERPEVKAKHDSAQQPPPMFAFPGHPSPTLPPNERIVQPVSADRDGAGMGGRGNVLRKKGHVKSHSTSHARLREDGVLAIPGDELERLVQAMDRNVNALREDIKKLVDEVNAHKHNPVYTSLTDIPPRFG